MNYHSILSMHPDRKITIPSCKHSFTLYLSLSPYWWTDRQAEWWRNEYTCCAWAGGTFFQLCCCVSFWFWREIGFGVTYVLRVQYSCGIVLVFWFWQETVFGITYILRVQYSCAVVSVFWLWREIVLKMRTPFDFLCAVSTKKSYWVTFLWSASQCVYFVRLFYSVSLYSVPFSCTLQIHKLKFKSEYYLWINSWNCVKTLLLCIFHLYSTDLEPYSHDHFL